MGCFSAHNIVCKLLGISFKPALLSQTHGSQQYDQQDGEGQSPNDGVDEQVEEPT